MEHNKRRFNAGYKLIWTDLVNVGRITRTTFGNLARDVVPGRIVQLPDDPGMTGRVQINVPKEVEYDIHALWLKNTVSGFVFNKYHDLVDKFNQILSNTDFYDFGVGRQRNRRSNIRNYSFKAVIKVGKETPDSGMLKADRWKIETEEISLRGLRGRAIHPAALARLLGVEVLKNLIKLFYQNPQDFFYQENEEKATEFWRDAKQPTFYESDEGAVIYEIKLLATEAPIRGMPNKAFFKEFILGLYLRDKRSFETLKEMLDSQLLSILHYPSVNRCFWNSLAISLTLEKMRIPTLDIFYSHSQIPRSKKKLSTKQWDALKKRVFKWNQTFKKTFHSTSKELMRLCGWENQDVLFSDLPEIFNKINKSRSRAVNNTLFEVIIVTPFHPVHTLLTNKDDSSRSLDLSVHVEKKVFGEKPSLFGNMNVGEPYRSPGPKYSRTIKMLIVGNHAWPLANYDDIRCTEHYYQDIFKDVQIPPARFPSTIYPEIDNCVLKQSGDMDAKLLAPIVGFWDIETMNIPLSEDPELAALEQEYDISRKKNLPSNVEAGLTGRVVPYSVQLYVPAESCLDLDNENYTNGVEWVGLGKTCFRDFLAKLFYSEEIPDKLTLLAHNGAKFDNVFLLDWLIKNVHTMYEKRMTVLIDWQSTILRGGVSKLTIRLCALKSRKTNRSKSITFMDTRPFANSSLRSLAAAFKVETQKGTFSYTSIKGWDSVMERSDDIIEYGLDDVKALAQVFKRVNNGFLGITAPLNPLFDPNSSEEDKLALGISPAHFMSAASYSRHVFYNYFHAAEDSDELGSPNAFWAPSLELDAEIRPYFFGGMVLSERLGAFHLNTAYVDFTSLYPYVMAKYCFPVGKPNRHSKRETQAIFSQDSLRGDGSALKDLLNRRFEGKTFLLRIKFRHVWYLDYEDGGDMEIQTGYAQGETLGGNWPPIFPIRMETGTVCFPYAENWQEHLVTKEELVYLSENEWCGMQIEVSGELYEFREARPFKAFIEYFFKFKRELDRTLDNNKLKPKEEQEDLTHLGAQRQACKDLLNSLFGSTAIDPTKAESLYMMDDCNETKLNCLRSIFPISKYLTIPYNLPKTKNREPITSKRVFLGIDTIMQTKNRTLFAGMSITAKSRLEMYKLRVFCLRNGFEFLYCDTDSAIMEGTYEDFMTALKNDPNVCQDWLGGRELGGLTDEKPGTQKDTMLGMMGAKNYIIGGKVKFKGFNINAKFVDKRIEQRDVTSVDENGEETVEKRTFLVLDKEFDNEYFVENNIVPQQFTIEDAWAYAKGDIHIISVTIRQLVLGRNLLGEALRQKGLKCQRITKHFQIGYSKGSIHSQDSKIYQLDPNLEVLDWVKTKPHIL